MFLGGSIALQLIQKCVFLKNRQGTITQYTWGLLTRDNYTRGLLKRDNCTWGLLTRENYTSTISYLISSTINPLL